jgi:hypothetical protein
VEVVAEDVANMFVAYESCTFIPDTTSRKASERGDGDLVVAVTRLGITNISQDFPECIEGFLPPVHVTVERAPGVVVKFSGGGRVYHGKKFIGWSYWEDDESYYVDETPCVNFKILAK